MMLDEAWRPSGAVLPRYTRNLTAEARAGRLAPVRGRDAEIGRVVDILLREGKNNPALVGPAGVGKTAVAEGLAARVAAGDVPLSLRDTRILALDHVALLAGTMYRGQYEERLRAIVAETTAARDAILFIDELHNLIGQGTALGVAMDAANMLKPALVRGDFRVIGATTEAEYEQWIRGDPALERRFQRVEVRELGSEATLDILRSRKPRLERHHHVVITPDALAAAVRLTDELVTDRVRPDRAIDALDEACAHVHATAQYSPRAEALIRERRALLGEAASAAEPPADAANEGGAGDSLDELARSGLAALERFGAELEAVLAGQAPPTPGRTAADAAGDTRSPAASSGRRARLAALEVELERQLLDEGVVVRGHDVARVVGLMTGRSVLWVE